MFNLKRHAIVLSVVLVLAQLLPFEGTPMAVQAAQAAQAAPAWLEDGSASGLPMAVDSLPPPSESDGAPAAISILEPEDEPAIQIIPPNPDYVAWLGGTDFGGLVPEPLVYTQSPDQRRRSVDTSLPRSYDPRADGYTTVTPVKDQGSVGACWAFASIGALESYAMRTTGAEMDFSEQHMRYALSNDGGNSLGFDRTNYGGGNFTMASAYYMRASAAGPVQEDDMPYTTSFDEIDASLFIDKARAGKVTGTIQIPNLAGSQTPGGDTSNTYKNQIKHAITDYGGVHVSYYSQQTVSGVSSGYYRLSSSGTYTYHYGSKMTSK